MDAELASSIGAVCRRARLALGWTQLDAAERVGVSVEFYARIERGGTLPSAPTLRALGATLGASVSEMLGLAAGTAPRASTPPAERLGTEGHEERLRRRVGRRLEAAELPTLQLVNDLLVQLDRMAPRNAKRRRPGRA